MFVEEKASGTGSRSVDSGDDVAGYGSRGFGTPGDAEPWAWAIPPSAGSCSGIGL